MTRTPPYGVPPQIVRIEKEAMPGTPLSPLPFLSFDDDTEEHADDLA